MTNLGNAFVNGGCRQAALSAAVCATAAVCLLLSSGAATARDAGLSWTPDIRINEPQETWTTNATVPKVINSPDVKEKAGKTSDQRKRPGGQKAFRSQLLTTGATKQPPNGPNGSEAAADIKAPPAGADDAKTATVPGTGTSEAAEEVRELANPSGRTLSQAYCDVVVDAALAAKLAQEKRDAEGLQKEIEKKLVELEAATAEQRKWLQLREDFQKKATENLVTVYAEMDVEAAAQRLPAVGNEIAAAILVKMPPRSASAILAEMPSDIAGRLTAYIAGAAELRPKSPEPVPKATQ